MQAWRVAKTSALFTAWTERVAFRKCYMQIDCSASDSGSHTDPRLIVSESGHNQSVITSKWNRLPASLSWRREERTSRFDSRRHHGSQTGNWIWSAQMTRWNFRKQNGSRAYSGWSRSDREKRIQPIFPSEALAELQRDKDMMSAYTDIHTLSHLQLSWGLGSEQVAKLQRFMIRMFRYTR